MESSLLVSCILLVAFTTRWFRQDNFARGYTDILDRGMFILTAGHIVIPLYIIWTKRLRGILLLLLSLLCYLLPSLVAMILL
jgi:hypothetical protein